MQLDFGAALRGFLSKQQASREYAAKQLLKEAKEPGAVSGVIAHHPELGFRPSVMAALSVHPRYAEEAARYLGAWHGLLTQDPDIVAFTVGDSGPDKLHHITAPIPPQELAQHLRDAGVNRFAVRPDAEGTHTTAHVYDKGGVYDFTPLASRLNGNVNISSGTGRRLSEGAAPTAGDAAKAYRRHIERAESAAGEAPDAPDRLRLARVSWDEGPPGTRSKQAKFPVGDANYNVAITRITPKRHHVVFERQKGGKFDTGITGSGNAREVLRGVVEHLKDHLETEKPLLLHFTSEEPSRRKLYSYLSSKLTGGSGYKAYEVDHKGLRDHYLVHDSVADKWHASAPKARIVTPAETPGKLNRPLE